MLPQKEIWKELRRWFTLFVWKMVNEKNYFILVHIIRWLSFINSESIFSHFFKAFLYLARKLIKRFGSNVNDDKAKSRPELPLKWKGSYWKTNWKFNFHWSCLAFLFFFVMWLTTFVSTTTVYCHVVPYDTQRQNLY